MIDVNDIDSFLATHWQKKPCFLPGVLAADLPQLSPDELAWMATQADVESRLIFTDHDGDRVRYRCESGPFTESALSELPAQDWTLLVQDVEKHLPDFRRYLELAAFVPDWRIDDLMVSCAAPGGSVGPHVDHYDVFLCQGAGAREWSIGRGSDVEVDHDADSLALVQPFPETANHRATTGDVLYLPPGIPHWGIASDLCTTYSIGCRAPSWHELELGKERVLGGPAAAGCSESRETFYTDPDLSAAESAPGKIDAKAIQRVRAQGLLDGALSDIELARVLGCVITDPKAWLMPEPPNTDAFMRHLQSAAEVEVHGMARLAWLELGPQRWVFVNGADREIDAQALAIVKVLCADRRLGEPASTLSVQRGLLSWMCREGLFDAGQSNE